MAGNIKGITVEIGGNTAPLQNALKDVNKESRSLQSELRTVNRNLKFNPNDTVMLTQKQKLLAESITNTKSKLQTLKEAEKQAQEQFKQGKISEQQYRALQQEISKTENQLKGLEKQQKELGNTASIHLKATGEKFKEVGGNITDVGKKVSAASAGVVAAGTAGVAAYKDVKSGIDEVTKATGATGKQADSLKESFKNVATQTGADMSALGQTMGEVNTRFDFTGKKLEDCTLQFTKFAKITGTDAKTAVQLVSRAMGDAGIKSSEYSKVLDMLAVAAQKSGVDVSKLTENLAKYGAPMRALGIDTKNSIALFAGWEKAGVNTEIAFSGMKKAISTWGKEGKDSGKEFSKVMKQIQDAPNISKATEIAIKNFGQKAGPDLADAIKGGRFAVDDYIKALDNSKGAVNNTSNQMKDGTEQMKVAFNAAKVAGAELGQTIISMLAPILQSVAAKAKEMATWFRSLSPEMKKTITIVGLIVAAIGPLIIFIGKIVTGIGAIAGALNVLMAHPIVLLIAAIVAGITALVLVIKHLWETNENFRNFIIGMWEGLKAAFSTMCNLFETVFSAAWEVIKAVVGAFTIYFKLQFEIIKTVFVVVVGILKQAWTVLWAAIKAIFTPVVNFLKQSWQGFKNVFVAVVNAIKSIWNTVCSVIKAVFTTVVAVLKTVWNGFKNSFTSVANGIKSIWNGTVNSVKSIWNTIKAPFQAVGNFIKSIWNGVGNGIKSMWNGVVNSVISAWNRITAPFKAVATSIGNIWRGIRNMIKLPHFSLRGEFSLSKMTVPHISVDWYSKGGIFKQPTILHGGIGVGDMYNGKGSNAEAVVPLDEMYKTIEGIISKYSVNVNNNGPSKIETVVNLDGREIARGVAPYKREFDYYDRGR